MTNKTTTHKQVLRSSGSSILSIAGQKDINTPISRGPLSLSYTNSVVGPDMPGYKRLIKNKSSATTSLDGTKYSVHLEEKPYFIRYQQKSGSKGTTTNTLSGLAAGNFSDQPVSFSTLPVFNNKANDLALGDLYSSVRDARSQFKGMTFLAELTETLALVHLKGSAIVKLVKRYDSEVKKLRKTSTKQRYLADLTDAYLEYTFGWAPLVYDMRDLGRAISAFARTMPTIRVHARGEFPDSSTSFTRVNYPVIDTRVRGTFRYERVSKSETFITGGLYLPPPCSPDGKLGELFGFSPEEFVPTAVEIFPFSFLLDYFSNFSDVVNAHFTYEPRFSYLARTTKVTNTRKWHVTMSGATLDSSDFTLQAAEGETTLVLESSKMSRRPYALPSGGPGFVVTNPAVKQVANMAALISSLSRLI